MSIQLAQPDLQRLVRIIQNLPEFGSQSDRQALVTLAFGTSGEAEVIRGRLSLNGAPMIAAVELVRFLSNFGQIELGIEALGMFLDQILMNMGISDEADFIAGIVEKYLLVNPPSAHVMSVAAPKLEIPSSKLDRYIFISYARAEQLIAEQVEVYLQTAGFRTFRDTSNIRFGIKRDMTIENALTETTHMVFLLSTASMPYRKEIHREWFYFDQNQKPLIPLLVQDCTLHTRIMTKNYIDARFNLADAFTKLVNVLLSM